MPLRVDMRVKLLLEREGVYPDKLDNHGQIPRSNATRLCRNGTGALLQSHKAVTPSTVRASVALSHGKCLPFSSESVTRAACPWASLFVDGGCLMRSERIRGRIRLFEFLFCRLLVVGGKIIIVLRVLVCTLQFSSRDLIFLWL